MLQNLSSKCIELRTPQDVLSAIAEYLGVNASDHDSHDLPHDHDDAIIFFDIDDTLILPRSKTFHHLPHRTLIDDLKSQKTRYPQFTKILSQWRLQRQAMLVHPDWPQVIDDLKAEYPVFGLTKVNTGRFGDINSMQDWRYQELKALGLIFSGHDDSHIKPKLDDDPDFHQGILMTGKATKYETLVAFQHQLPKASTFIFIDDRIENVKEIQRYCEAHSLSYLGIHFTGIDLLQGDVDPAVVALQKDTLICDYKWLEDDEASHLLP